MSINPESIYEIKQGFLSSQVRILERPVQLPHDWLANAPEADQNDIPDGEITKVLNRLALKLTKHRNLVYGTRAQQAVADQLDSLYWQSSRAEHHGDDEAEDVLNGHADLTDQCVVEALPSQWPDESEGTEEQQEQYQNLTARLVTTSNAISTLRQRHAYYLARRQELEVFAKPTVEVQPNLVVKGGDIAKELDRMRVLTARFTQTVANNKRQLKASQEAHMLEGGECDDMIDDDTSSEALGAIHGL